jgi:hypothetical protein
LSTVSNASSPRAKWSRSVSGKTHTVTTLSFGSDRLRASDPWTEHSSQERRRAASIGS